MPQDATACYASATATTSGVCAAARGVLIAPSEPYRHHCRAAFYARRFLLPSRPLIFLLGRCSSRRVPGRRWTAASVHPGASKRKASCYSSDVCNCPPTLLVQAAPKPSWLQQPLQDLRLHPKTLQAWQGACVQQGRRLTWRWSSPTSQQWRQACSPSTSCAQRP